MRAAERPLIRRVTQLLVAAIALSLLGYEVSRAVVVTDRRRSANEQVLAARAAARRSCLANALTRIPQGATVLFYPDPDAILTKLSSPRLTPVGTALDARFEVALTGDVRATGVRCGEETVTVRRLEQP